MNILFWFCEKQLKKDVQWESRALAQKLYDLVLTVPGWAEFLKQ